MDRRARLQRHRFISEETLIGVVLQTPASERKYLTNNSFQISFYKKKNKKFVKVTLWIEDSKNLARAKTRQTVPRRHFCDIQPKENYRIPRGTKFCERAIRKFKHDSPKLSCEILVIFMPRDYIRVVVAYFPDISACFLSDVSNG